eukprot:TRINITY_DN10084_c0_g1_i5.p1 TRINITY_DN10084_c0_g1~~TRINITY_DN10084_c0_g1_i5.p1  ORF type:complete len:1104 (-),score=237.24 TRINITY_DN10084_c0_g1_i5:229-3330(-)
MSELGASSRGWSQVGLGISKSLHADLDLKMNEVSELMLGGLEHITLVQDSLDAVLSLVGNETDTAISKSPELSLLQTHGPERGLVLLQEMKQTKNESADAIVASLTPLIKESIHKVLNKIMLEVHNSLQKLLTKIKPALTQIGAWMVKFGDKIQAGIEEFSVTLDRAQKIFDAVMASLHGQGKNHAEMLDTVWELFDVTEDGKVTAEDLKQVADVFSMSALAGSKAQEMIDKYDTDGDKYVNKEELGKLVNDKSIPGAMSVMLRIYAKKLTEIAGKVAAARQRDEVAAAVVDYLRLRAAKNMTRVGWVADALGNRSLPLDFTASVMAEICLTGKDPNLPRFTTANPGTLLVGEMFRVHPQNTLHALDLMSNTTWWAGQGLDIDKQPDCLASVTTWVAEAKNFDESGLIQTSGSHLPKRDLGDTARKLATESVNLYRLDLLQAKEEAQSSLFKSQTSQVLLAHLLGGVSPSQVGGESAAQEAIGKGVPAAPETLQWAQWLANNATASSQRYQHMCFEYSSESSNAVDSFATQLQGMVKKMQGFLEMMKTHSTPSGIQRLEDQVQDFIEHSMKDVMNLVESRLDKLINQSVPAVNSALHRAAHDAGEKIGAMISNTVSQPIREALTDPMKEAVGDLLENNKTGEIIGSKLGEELGNTISNLATDKLGKATGDLLDSLVTRSLEEGGNVLDDMVKKMPEAVSLPQQQRHQQKKVMELDIDIEEFFSRKAPVPDPRFGNLILLQSIGADGSDAEGIDEIAEKLSGAWQDMVNTLRSFANLLPRAVTTLKGARREVSKLSSSLDSIFEVFLEKGPATFDSVASSWRTMWQMYFMCLAPLCLCSLFYGFWAKGYFGGPTPLPEGEEDSTPDPQTFRERCFLTLACGMNSWRQFHDSSICLWSVLILFEILVLVTFLVAILLCIVAGIKAFLVAGCSQIYVLEDPTVCTQALGHVKGFLETFNIGNATDVLTADAISDACASNALLTCQVISTKMTAATIMTTLFSFLAAIFTMQMLFDSAILHEQAAFRRKAAALASKE